MLTVGLFLVCLIATALGAVGGFGGGVIIKPVVDALGVLPISTVSFLSTCTVLCMTVVSVARSAKAGMKLDLKMAVPLALGAAVGGVGGKFVFDLVKQQFASEALIGRIQAGLLIVMTAAVMVSILRRNRGKSKSYHSKSIAVTAAVGALLGFVSSFIGIGGGPYNVAVLLLLFGMEAKPAAKYSLFIVLFCQAANVLLSLARGTVPEFSWLHMAVMACGGVGGALLGARISKKVSDKTVEWLVLALMIFVIATNVYNLIMFSFV